MIRRAVQTKNPDIVWAVEVMRKIGSSGVTTGVLGTHDVLDPCGAVVAGDPRVRPLGESFSNLSDSRLTLHQS